MRTWQQKGVNNISTVLDLGQRALSGERKYSRL